MLTLNGMNTHIDPDIREYVRLREAGQDNEADALWDRMSAEQDAKVQAQVAAQEAAHAAFHGRPPRYVTVERRRGYRGRSVCADCYYEKEWK